MKAARRFFALREGISGRKNEQTVKKTKEKTVLREFVLAVFAGFLYNRFVVQAKQIGDAVTMQKKSLLALLLALMMLLSGCALITTDTEKDNARVILDVNGQTVNKATISNAVQNQISQNQYYNQLYSAYGISLNYPTDEATVTEQVVQSYVERLVSGQKAKELGLDQLTEEEKAETDATAQETFNTFIESVISSYMPGSKLEGDELTQAAIKYVADRGVTTGDGRSTLEDFQESAALDKAIEKLKEYMIKDVEVTEEEIQADFDAKVESAKADYEADPNSYGTSVNAGSTVYYAPAGYRRIQHILIPFDSSDEALTAAKTAQTEAQSALDAANEALTNAAEDADKDALQAAVTEAESKLAEAQAALDAATEANKAAAKAKADDVYAQAIAEGADFDALVTEYSTDSMPAQGYAVREGFTDFVTEFVETAMALENPGDISEPVESTYGYHIIKYVEDIPEGPVDLDTVRDSISASLLTAKQDDTATATLAQLVIEAKVTKYLDRLN